MKLIGVMTNPSEVGTILRHHILGCMPHVAAGGVNTSTATVPESACRSLGRQPFRKKRREPAWARLIAKIYDVDPLVCPRCSSKMRILAVITDPGEVKKILPHLIKIGRP